MWEPDIKRVYKYPDQCREAQRKLKELDTLRTNLEKQISSLTIKIGTLGTAILLDPLLQKMKIFKRADDLRDKLQELTYTAPNDWRLTWDTPFSHRGYNITERNRPGRSRRNVDLYGNPIDELPSDALDNTLSRGRSNALTAILNEMPSPTRNLDGAPIYSMSDA